MVRDERTQAQQVAAIQQPVVAAVQASAESLHAAAVAQDNLAALLQGPAASATPDGEPLPIDGTRNVTDALGFLKDWVSALVTLETAAIGAIGAFLGLKASGTAGATPTVLPLIVSAGLAPSSLVHAAWFTLLPGFLVCLTVACFIGSIYFGLHVLYMLPGSAQRIPRPTVDVFSLTTVGNKTIGYWATGHWRLFVAGIVLFGCFIVVQILSL